MKVLSFFSICMLLLSHPCLAQPKYEFRAAWIATVANIDWPTRGNYDTEKQKEEYRALLDLHVKNGMNAVVVQIRPAADAFYPSAYEPWSEWLTGKQGKAPHPYYDPLQFMIEEAHKRGLEFHAWCNPYRAEMTVGKSSIAANHITRKRPDWFVVYGGKRYFDPGNREAQDFVVKVIRDIVKRYDVDALHFDDYFYPYRIPNREFPDGRSYARHGKGMARDDWRRSNVDSIIVKLSRAIKEENPHCRFGISPFGVWRNKSKDSLGSETTAGQTNYDDLYADILLWLREGYIDYVVPQLYWEHEHRAAPYEVLVDWWARYSYGRHCYIGLGVYKAGTNTRWRDTDIIPRQIRDARQYETLQGQVYFSSKSFLSNPNGWNDSLRNNYYKYPALIPPMPWIDSTPPLPPDVSVRVKPGSDDWLTLAVNNLHQTKKIRKLVLYLFRGHEGSDIARKVPHAIIPMTGDSLEWQLSVAALADRVPPDECLYFGFSAVDAVNVESALGPVRELIYDPQTQTRVLAP